MKAILRRTRISPKKANLVAQLVRLKKATEAIDILKFTPKKAAKILKKVIESAIANAENNNKQIKDNLYIKEIIVTEGPTYKRSLPISRGRVHPILKRTSHITAKLEARNAESEAAASGGTSKDKTAKKPESKTKLETKKQESKPKVKSKPKSTKK
jgi:large subunit ribosomal protein L22